MVMRHYYTDSWNCGIGLDDSVVCKDLDDKVHVVHDILRSSTRDGDSIAVFKIGGKNVQVPLKTCVIVPTPKTMKFVPQSSLQGENSGKNLIALGVGDARLALFCPAFCCPAQISPILYFSNDGPISRHE